MDSTQEAGYTRLLCIIITYYSGDAKDVTQITGRAGRKCSDATQHTEVENQKKFKWKTLIVLMKGNNLMSAQRKILILRSSTVRTQIDQKEKINKAMFPIKISLPPITITSGGRKKMRISCKLLDRVILLWFVVSFVVRETEVAEKLRSILLANKLTKVSTEMFSQSTLVRRELLAVEDIGLTFVDRCELQSS